MALKIMEKNLQTQHHIFCIMGKSASGKDYIYSHLLNYFPDFRPVILYTTRPVRSGENNGVDYYFVSDDDIKRFTELNKVIEKRVYNTVFGPWIYATVDDGQIDLSEYDSLVIGTLESFSSFKRYFGTEAVIPVFIETDDGLRLTRALEREKQQVSPAYAELCRRFLADEMDFSAERIRDAGIVSKFINDQSDRCLLDIKKMISDVRSGKFKGYTETQDRQDSEHE